MSLFPTTTYQKLSSKVPKTPKLSFGMGKSLAPNVKIPKIAGIKTPSSTSLKSFDSSKFMGLTASQKSAKSMFDSVKPKKLAIVKVKIAKLKK